MKIKRKIAAAVLPGAEKSVFRKKVAGKMRREKKGGGERKLQSNCSGAGTANCPKASAVCGYWKSFAIC